MKRLSWYLALPGIVGIALVIAAVLLLVTMTTGKTPTASAAGGCGLSLVKTANEEFVPEGGSIEWTLTVTNDSSQICYDVSVEDDLDTVTTCTDVEADVGDPTCGPPVLWDVRRSGPRC